MFFKHKNFFKISKKILNHNPKKLVERINLHENTKDKDQCMIIWQKKAYCHKPKKFLDSHKVYVCLKGSLKILILSASGKIIKTMILDSKKNNFCRIKRNVFHADVSVTKYALHCEITNHSYVKRRIVYLNDISYKNFKKRYAKIIK
jgi:cupin fold WbuC family metalloprotein